MDGLMVYPACDAEIQFSIIPAQSHKASLGVSGRDDLIHHAV
jgi:hypothetical protein